MIKLFSNAIFLSLTFLFICSSTFALDGKPLVLGMSAAFTGPSKGLGIELYRGSQAYFNQVNDNGGINGRKIVTKYYDDGYNPLPAIKNTIRLVKDDDVLCLFNYVGTPTVTRVLPVIKHFNTEKQVYLFFPFTGAQPQREFPYDQYVFNLRSSYRQETKGLVRNLTRIGRKKIAVMYQADAYGRSGWDGIRRALSEVKLGIAAEATYSRGAGFKQSMAEQVKIIAAVKPDAIISVGAYEACAAFIRDARDAGLDIPICNLSFVGSENMLELLVRLNKKTGKDYTKNLINSQTVPSYEDTDLPAVNEYRKIMTENPPPPPEGFGKGYTPLKFSYISFEGYLNAKVMCRVLERMGMGEDFGNLYSETISIHNLDIGIGTKINFGMDRHQGLDKIYYTTVSNEKFMPLIDWTRWNK